jgi:hypothetical protein
VIVSELEPLSDSDEPLSAPDESEHTEMHFDPVFDARLIALVRPSRGRFDVDVIVIQGGTA